MAETLYNLRSLGFKHGSDATQVASNVKLPAELFDIIFGLLRSPDCEHSSADGKQDLMACNAVCRSWREIAVLHLFRDLVFTFHCKVVIKDWSSNLGTWRPLSILRIAMPEEQMENPDREGPPRTLLTLLSFLEDTPHIGRLVRRLSIRCSINDGAHTDELPFPREARITPLLLLSLCDSVPRLRVLHLCNIALDDIPFIGTTLCPPLDRLHIDYARGKDTYWHMPDIETSQLLACFTGIEELHIRGSGKWRNRVCRDDYSGPHALRVNRLVLEQIHNGGILFRHLLSSAAANISTLIIRQLELNTPNDITAFNRFLFAIGPQLQIFRIYLQNHHFRFGSQLINIAPCHNILELTLGFTLPIFAASQCNRAIEDARQLINIASPVRERYPALLSIILEITFDTKTFRSVSDPNEDWVTGLRSLGPLDETLVAAVAQCGLDGVYFEVIVDSKLDVDVTIQKMFPRLRAKDQLLVRGLRKGVWQTCVE